MARYEVAVGSVSFRTPFGGRKKYKAGDVATDIPAESVPWLLGGGVIRPAPSASRAPARTEPDAAPAGEAPAARPTGAGRGGR